MGAKFRSIDTEVEARMRWILMNLEKVLDLLLIRWSLPAVMLLKVIIIIE
jgi:hypothetical protein